MLKQQSELTFKHNLKRGRHGWIRLTPAYSIKLVQNILSENTQITHVLDPFSGSGTTGLVCGEQGRACDLIDINPFLIWLAKAKTRNYTAVELDQAKLAAGTAIKWTLENKKPENLWIPPISHIERWWHEDILLFLARLNYAISEIVQVQPNSKDLLLVAFCKILIESSNAAFNHQSMSFKNSTDKNAGLGKLEFLDQLYLESVSEIVVSASDSIQGQVTPINSDSRHIPQIPRYNGVITSPPYPNRMSYIRELRQYMYWLKFLDEPREAGELDWKAIGGTWGIATSRLQQWEPDGQKIHHEGFETIIQDIGKKSLLLANYVHRYFVDIDAHLSSLSGSLLPGARVFYIVGNSKFYDTLVPVEQIYASLFDKIGFVDIKVDTLRKRNSKKELIEFVVSARKN